MNTDRRSWILSVLSALPLMKFLKPKPVEKFPYDFRIPPDKKAELNQLGEGNIISSSWAVPSADISVDCLKIHQEYMKQIGQPY